MRTRLDLGVELLERSLAYACGVLAEVSEADLTRPTPCAAWDLDRLLAHLEDGLGAFEEAAAGWVAPQPAPGPTGAAHRVDALRGRATAVLGAWVGAPDALPPRVRLGDADLDTALLVHTAALEVAVHAHDVAVATATEASHPLPEELARGLLAVAEEVVAPGDRPGRFAAPRTCPGEASYAGLLLAHLGR